MVKDHTRMKAGLFAASVRRLLTPGSGWRTGSARTATAGQFLSVWLITLLASSPAWGLTTNAWKNQTCAGYRSGSLNCTAGEFTVSPVFSATPGTSPFCVAGRDFDFKVDLGLSGTNTDRMDIGFFVGQIGNDPRSTAGGNNCSVATFPTTSAPWENNDGDACGDFDGKASDTVTIDEIRVVCTGDSTGALQVPYVLTYWQNNGDVCTGPDTIRNGAPSKCNYGISTVSGDVKVFSGAYVDVTKQTLPDGDPQTFTFSATTADTNTKVIALTGSTTLIPTGPPPAPQYPSDGTYTPATIDLATNSVNNITLTDGQTARFYINALTASQDLIIQETAATNWESTASITCSPGLPTLTFDNATRTITAGLSTANSAATCTITNTKRSRMTLVKSVGGRLVGGDQFTVSASGGGTLTGTTSAATSGSETSASTTFYSTPNTPLTLDDVKTSGPTPMSQYESLLTCTNAFTGSGATPNTSLPHKSPVTTYTFSPAPGDDITCTYINTPKALLTKAFGAGTIGAGRPSTLTFTIANPSGAPAQTGGVTFTDTFPANMVIADVPNVVNTCGGTPTITADAGDGSFTVGGTGVNAAAGPSTCTVSVDVTSLTPLAGYVNGAAQITAISSSLRNGVTDQTLNVVRAGLTKAFSPTTIDQGEISTLTFTLTNGAGNPAQSGIEFTDTLPGNVTVAATPNITSTCPSGTGVVAAAAGAGSIVVTGASMNSGQASCAISVDVTSNIPGGPYNNTNASISGTARLTNSVTTSGLTVQPKATVTIVKQSNGGTGSFNFSGGTNGMPASLTLDTGAANPMSSSAYMVTANGVDTAITETIPANWELTGADCTDGSSTFGALSGGTLTIPAAKVATGKAITCTFTNTLLLPNLTVLKYAFGVASGATAKPGQEIPYSITVSNTGPGVAGNVVVVDCLGIYSAWTLNTFAFTDGAAPSSGPSGLSLTNSTMYYSNDNGSTWSAAAPTDDGTGHAPAVTCWKLVMDPAKSMNASPSSFTLTYQANVK